MTFATKYVQGGLYSSYNNYDDISLDYRYVAMMGFTLEELKSY
jgi:hypothetical protein